jgi:hypothetical protein
MSSSASSSSHHPIKERSFAKWKEASMVKRTQACGESVVLSDKPAPLHAITVLVILHVRPRKKPQRHQGGDERPNDRNLLRRTGEGGK